MQMTIEWFAICVINLVQNAMISTLKTVLHAITPNFCTRICVFNHAQEDTMNLSMLLIHLSENVKYVRFPSTAKHAHIMALMYSASPANTDTSIRMIKPAQLDATLVNTKTHGIKVVMIAMLTAMIVRDLINRSALTARLGNIISAILLEDIVWMTARKRDTSA